MEISIPAGTARVRLLIRHTYDVKQGNEMTRTITSEGIELCRKVSPFYKSLITGLEKNFGTPIYYASEMIRSDLTLWEIFHPSQIIRDPLLDMIASLKKIKKGKWVQEMKSLGKKIPEIIQIFLKDVSLWKGQPFAEYRNNYLEFTVSGNEKFKVAVAHDLGISLVAVGIVPEEQLEIEKCEAFLFYLDEKHIIGAEKIIPSEQEPVDRSAGGPCAHGCL